VVVAAGVRRPQFAVVAGLVYALVPHLVSDYVTESVHLPVILFGLAGLALANDPDGYCAAVSVRMHRRRGLGATEDAYSGAGAGAEAEAAAGARSGIGAGDRLSTGPLPQTAAAPNGQLETHPAALELRRVRAGYDGAPVLHGVGLAVRPGEILALLGPNGAGKSTTCRVAAGLVAPLGGQVYVAGRDATREGAVRRSRAGVVLAPEGRGIFPALTIEENLALYLREKDQREAVYERFPVLAGRRGVVAGSLSGGEQQMLALAPLLQRPPKVLIADEPSLGLAPRVVEEVFRLLTELRDAGAALLLVEEKATEVLGVTDTVAYLAQGRVTWCGPRTEVEADRLTEAYLGLAGASSDEAGAPEPDTPEADVPEAGAPAPDTPEAGAPEPGPPKPGASEAATASSNDRPGSAGSRSDQGAVRP
jgi:ABC-type branched-subunit amino acid transport system ATPase component